MTSALLDYLHQRQDRLTHEHDSATADLLAIEDEQALLVDLIQQASEPAPVPSPPAPADDAHASAAPRLPASVYADLANPAIADVIFPSGTWYLPGDAPLLVQRSNVTLHMTGCQLRVNPADKANSQFDGLSIKSVSKVDQTFDANGRTIARAAGVITADTRTLTMAAGEVVTLQPGETVLIWAGVTPSDPVEVESYIPATVASVKGRVVTFSAPLGLAVTNYGSLAALTSKTAADLQWKIGAWGAYTSEGSFSKGYGTDHGIERFVGGMVQNVTVIDPQIVADAMIGQTAQLPNGAFLVSVQAAQHVTIQNLTIANPVGSALHLWRAFTVNVNGYHVSGQGLSRIWTRNTAEATACSIWGGRGLTLTDVALDAFDVSMFNVEIGARDIWLNGAQIHVTYTAARDYASPSVVFGLFSTLSRTRCTNVTLDAKTTGGSAHAYLAGTVAFDGAFVIPTLPTDYMAFDPASGGVFSGTVSLGGVTYGPVTALSQTFPLAHGASFRTCLMPAGLFTGGTFDVVTRGDLRDVTDNFGVEYWTPTGPQTGIPLSPKWFRSDIGDPNLTQFLNKQLIGYLNNAGSLSDGLIRVQATYLPRVS